MFNIGGHRWGWGPYRDILEIKHMFWYRSISQTAVADCVQYTVLLSKEQIALHTRWLQCSGCCVLNGYTFPSTSSSCQITHPVSDANISFTLAGCDSISLLDRSFVLSTASVSCFIFCAFKSSILPYQALPFRTLSSTALCVNRFPVASFDESCFPALSSRFTSWFSCIHSSKSTVPFRAQIILLASITARTLLEVWSLYQFHFDLFT